MNDIETQMVCILKDLKASYSLAGVKAEFEAEGTRTEELMRLKEICTLAQTPLVLKIGGCEAIRDMYDARSIGVNMLVAPMAETPFAVQKYLRAVRNVFPPDEIEIVDVLVNIETIQAVRNFEAMLKIPEIRDLSGVVLGRVDLVGSLGLDRKSVNSEEVYAIALKMFTLAKKRKMECVLGGAISADSLSFLRKLPGGLVDRYETRKICFRCPEALGDNAIDGIQKAVQFELLWLKNKRNYYRTISDEDKKRIVMLENRCHKRPKELMSQKAG